MCKLLMKVLLKGWHTSQMPDGVIGMEYSTSITRFLTGIPERYEVAAGTSTQVNAVEVDIDVKTGNAISIKRIFCRKNKIEEEKESEEES